MFVSVDLCMIPLGKGLSLSPYIASCQRVLKEHGLTCNLHAYGTNIEGDWDVVFNAIKACHEVLHASGVVRIHTSIKCGTRTDKQQCLQDKIDSVETLL